VYLQEVSLGTELVAGIVQRLLAAGTAARDMVVDMQGVTALAFRSNVYAVCCMMKDLQERLAVGQAERLRVRLLRCRISFAGVFERKRGRASR
jgi:hypothetical protein